MRAIANLLRRDNGEGSIVATIAGSILFLLASVSIMGFAITSLGSSNIAQANSELTASMIEDAQTWEKTPWGELQEHAATEYELDVAGRTYNVLRRVTLLDEINAYRLDMTIPRVGLPGTVPTNCLKALDKPIDGCITVSGTVTATSDELTPRTPRGVTLVTERVDIGAGADTLIDLDFEAAATLNVDNGDGDITYIETPRVDGAHAFRFRGGFGSATTATSDFAAIPADSRVAVTAWVRVAEGSANPRIQIEAAYRYPNNATTTATIATITGQSSKGVWKRATATVNVPAGATAVAVRGTLTCDNYGHSSCEGLVDDIRVVSLARNLVTDPGAETGTGWEAVGDFAITTAPGQNVNTGTKAVVVGGEGDGYVTAPAATIPELGDYLARIWVAGGITTEATGNLTIELLDQDGNTLHRVDREAAALDTAFTAINMPFTVASGSITSVTVRAITNGISGRTITLDDAALIQQAGVHPDPSANGYIHLATFDPTQFEEAKTFRVSFEWAGDGPAPTDLTIAIYCGIDGKQLEVSNGRMSVLTTEGANPTEWEWARVILPELGRLQACESPTLRLYHTDGGAPEASAISKLSVLPVMAGIKTPGSTP